MNKILTYILVSTLIVSCNGKTKSDEKSESDQSEASNNEEKELKMDPDYAGYYLERAYYNILLETRSTREAHEKNGAWIYVITKDQKFIPMTLHEGANEMDIKMVDHETGIVQESSGSGIKLVFGLERLTANGKTFHKAHKASWEGVNEMINEAVISGRYFLNDGFVEFKVDGSIEGLDSLTEYSLTTDYIGPGLNLDLISIINSKSKKEENFIYQFDGDTLKLFTIKCLEEESDFCLEIDKDKVFLKLLK